MKSAWVGGAVALVAALAAGLFFLVGGSEDGPDSAEVAPAPLEPPKVEVESVEIAPESTLETEEIAEEVAEEVPDEPAPTETAEVEQDPEPVVASERTGATFDIVRVEPDGTAVIAGRAEPGVGLNVLVDGELVEAAVVGDDGGFVSFLSLGRSDVPRVVR